MEEHFKEHRQHVASTVLPFIKGKLSEDQVTLTERYLAENAKDNIEASHDVFYDLWNDIFPHRAIVPDLNLLVHLNVYLSLLCPTINHYNQLFDNRKFWDKVTKLVRLTCSCPCRVHAWVVTPLHLHAHVFVHLHILLSLHLQRDSA